MPDDSRQHPQRRRVQLLVGSCLVGTGVGVASYLLKPPRPRTNLVVPVYRFDGDSRVVVGEA